MRRRGESRARRRLVGPALLLPTPRRHRRGLRPFVHENPATFPPTTGRWARRVRVELARPCAASSTASTPSSWRGLGALWQVEMGWRARHAGGRDGRACRTDRNPVSGTPRCLHPRMSARRDDRGCEHRRRSERIKGSFGSRGRVHDCAPFSVQLNVGVKRGRKGVRLGSRFRVDLGSVWDRKGPGLDPVFGSVSGR